MDIAEWIVRKFDHISNGRITSVIVGLSIVMLVLGFMVWKKSDNFSKFVMVKRPVLVSSFPLSEIVSRVGGEVIEVHTLLEKGQSPMANDLKIPENYEKAKLVFLFGGKVDDWVNKVVDASTQRVEVAGSGIVKTFDKSLVVNLDSSYSASLIEGEDLYYWVSPVNALFIAKNVKDVLINEYPEYAEQIEKSHNEYAKKLAFLDSKVRKDSPDLVGAEIVTVGATWKHLARDYGVKIGAELDYPKDDGVVANKLKSVIEQVGARVIYVDPMVNVSLIKSVADEFGLPIILLDPFGGVKERETYERMVEYNFKQIGNWR